MQCDESDDAIDRIYAEKYNLSALSAAAEDAGDDEDSDDEDHDHNKVLRMQTPAEVSLVRSLAP